MMPCSVSVCVVAVVEGAVVVVLSLPQAELSPAKASSQIKKV
jgi:hypothetical protein